ncbi:SRSO17 transposase [Streptomyces sp. LBL]|nr:SRSO17 transposase [Streptomyces sp. LBL]
MRAGVRWKIEENNELAKQINGLGQYQVRRGPPGTGTAPG